MKRYEKKIYIVTQKLQLYIGFQLPLAIRKLSRNTKIEGANPTK